MFRVIIRKLSCSEGDKMTAVAKWITEKESILKLPLEDKRNLYKVKNYLTLNQVESWDMQLLKFPTIKVKKPTSDDLIEFKKMTIDTEKSKRLAQQVSLFKGDITTLEIDAIVNAANSRLKAGGGVDGAIHRAAGPLLQAECDTLHGCPTGEAKITGGYNLPAKYIIHTVGPQDGSESKLQSCYENCFTILKENQLKSIAFPCISTGIYGFPNEQAAHIALRTARKALEADESIARVIFCTFLEKDVDIYERVMQMYFPVE